MLCFRRSLSPCIFSAASLETPKYGSTRFHPLTFLPEPFPSLDLPSKQHLLPFRLTSLNSIFSLSVSFDLFKTLYLPPGTQASRLCMDLLQRCTNALESGGREERSTPHLRLLVGAAVQQIVELNESGGGVLPDLARQLLGLIRHHGADYHFVSAAAALACRAPGCCPSEAEFQVDSISLLPPSQTVSRFYLSCSVIRKKSCFKCVPLASSFSCPLLLPSLILLPSLLLLPSPSFKCVGSASFASPLLFSSSPPLSDSLSSFFLCVFSVFNLLQCSPLLVHPLLLYISSSFLLRSLPPFSLLLYPPLLLPALCALGPSLSLLSSLPVRSFVSLSFCPLLLPVALAGTLMDRGGGGAGGAGVMERGQNISYVVLHVVQCYITESLRSVGSALTAQICWKLYSGS